MKQAIPTAEQEIRNYFKAAGLEFAESVNLERARNRHERQLCLKQLKSDEQELKDTYKTMLADMQKWRRSLEYEGFLQFKIEGICAYVDDKISEWIPTTIDAQIIQTRDTSGGFIVEEIAVVNFLTLADQYLRELIEEQGQELAQYFLDKFLDNLNRYRVREQLVEKSYNQQYIDKKLQPLSTLHSVETIIDSEFHHICRWIAVYELMQSPLVSARDETIDGIQKVTKFLAGEIASSAILAGRPNVLPPDACGAYRQEI